MLNIKLIRLNVFTCTEARHSLILEIFQQSNNQSRAILFFAGIEITHFDHVRNYLDHFRGTKYINILRKSSFWNMHLTAVNLQNRRPSTISTSKITHVTENRDWFRVNKKGNHTTNIGAILWETITDMTVIDIILLETIINYYHCD